VENVLGGKGVVGAKPRSSLDWIGTIREGIPAAAVESVLFASWRPLRPLRKLRLQGGNVGTQIGDFVLKVFPQQEFL
jgi:hypothetical protein